MKLSNPIWRCNLQYAFIPEQAEAEIIHADRCYASTAASAMRVWVPRVDRHAPLSGRGSSVQLPAALPASRPPSCWRTTERETALHKEGPPASSRQGRRMNWVTSLCTEAEACNPSPILLSAHGVMYEIVTRRS